MARMGKSKPVKTDEATIAAKHGAKKAKCEEATATAKKVNPNLVATIERRKKEALASGAKPSFGRPPARRGRKPKNLADYTPEHQEEDGSALESSSEGIEYDTGIKVSPANEDRGYNVEVDFDEELNFDW